MKQLFMLREMYREYLAQAFDYDVVEYALSFKLWYQEPYQPWNRL